MSGRGVSCLEISYTLPNAGEVIQALREKFQDRLIIGAGTVLDSENSQTCHTSQCAVYHSTEFFSGGSRYVQPVSDSLCAGLYDINGSTSGPEAGAAFIKAFPISDFYGPRLVSVFKTPIPYMPILASGGIDLKI